MRNAKIGFVLQEFGLIEDRTILENIYVPLFFSRRSIKSQQAKATATAKRAKDSLSTFINKHLFRQIVLEYWGSKHAEISSARLSGSAEAEEMMVDKADSYGS